MALHPDPVFGGIGQLSVSKFLLAHNPGIWEWRSGREWGFATGSWLQLLLQQMLERPTLMLLIRTKK